MGKLALAAVCMMIAGIQPASSKEYAVFDVVGDSISIGVNPETSGDYGWADMLFGSAKDPIPAKTNTVSTLWPGMAFHNSAVSGSTASDWASDWQGHLSGVKNRQPDLVIVLIGGNDLLGSIQDGFVSLADIEQYYTNLTEIVTNLQNNIPIPDIVMMTYFDPFDGFSANLAGSLGYLTNATPTTLAANQIIRNVAMEQGCYLVAGTRAAFLHHGYGGELGDAQHSMPAYLQLPLDQFNVHPVTAGYSVLYELVYEKLTYLKQYAVPETWMVRYGLTNYAADVALDQDSDGAATWEEYVAGTDPTNGQSVFTIHLEYPALSWNVVPGRYYTVTSSTNLNTDFDTQASNLLSGYYTDSVHQTERKLYYRVEVGIDNL